MLTVKSADYKNIVGILHLSMTELVLLLVLSFSCRFDLMVRHQKRQILYVVGHQESIIPVRLRAGLPTEIKVSKFYRETERIVFSENVEFWFQKRQACKLVTILKRNSKSLRHNYCQSILETCRPETHNMGLKRCIGQQPK